MLPASSTSLPDGGREDDRGAAAPRMTEQPELPGAQAWKSAKPEQTWRTPRMVTAAAARRELEDLRAAINHHRREGLCSEIVSVALPPRTAARERGLRETKRRDCSGPLGAPSKSCGTRTPSGL